MVVSGKKRKSDNIKFISSKGVSLLTIVFSILIVSINLTSAIEIEMNPEFSQGETLIAKISGNFVDALSASNILFYRDHVRIPMVFNVSKITDDYYLYALLSGKTAGNYSLQIKGVRYYRANKIISDDLIKNFTISGQLADFYVSPGFLKTKKDFSIEIVNLKDNNMNVEITENSSSSGTGFFESLFGAGGSSQAAEVPPGETRKVNFGFENLTENMNESAISIISLKSENTSYFVPVYLDVNASETNNVKENGKLRFEPVYLNISISTNSNTSRIFYLYNDGEDTIKNISIAVSDSLEPYVNLSIENISKLDGNSSVKMGLLIFSGNEEDNVAGQITAEYQKNDSSYSSETFDVYLNFIDDYVPSFEENGTAIDSQSCSELKGTICAQNETCSGDSAYAKDGKCCLASCNASEPSSSAGKIIGWSLVGLVILFLAWFFIKKYKKVSNPVDLLKASRGKR